MFVALFCKISKNILNLVIYGKDRVELMSLHSAKKAFSGNICEKVKDPNLICALTGHKEGSKAFNRYRMIDEETNRQTMSYLE